MVGDLNVLVVSDEAPNALTVRAEISGLPNVPQIVKQVVQAGQGNRRRMTVVHSRPQ